MHSVCRSVYSSISIYTVYAVVYTVYTVYTLVYTVYTVVYTVYSVNIAQYPPHPLTPAITAGSH